MQYDVVDYIIELQNNYEINKCLKEKINTKIEWLYNNILENDYASNEDKDIAEYQVDILKELTEKENKNG